VIPVEIEEPPPSPVISQPPVAPVPPQPVIPPKPSVPAGGGMATQLQLQVARLFHLQTNTNFELPQNLSVIHIGKPNDRIPPDIDVSGVPDSDIISRVHADIRVEGDSFYIEDVGSANGTYINHTPLLPGNRHRLRTGDRIALGKGDKVTLIFNLS
jgi:pSer/pThr/pTyr-binding forkhead associated (FHA) protein